LQEGIETKKIGILYKENKYAKNWRNIQASKNSLLQQTQFEYPEHSFIQKK